MSKPRETRLYAPVKAYLEAQGYCVKGEIGSADVVALRSDEPPLIVELKNGFSLVLLQQAVARQAVTDTVYVALPRWHGKPGWRAFKANIGLCKRLGIGVISVRETDGFVQVHIDPAPFQPRKSKARKAALLKEFAAREGDPTMGGTNGQVMTAYRQDARRIADYLAKAGPSKGAEVARATGVARATTIMADNHYGWFFRVARGIYSLNDAGAAR
ncbi:FIG00990273: hypothetical protein [hydrothermal vent metagenome]|uniref:Uncharacterized protein n=1 Tax=hydrothermal vent metagenome TaxID=652676 RepID=A0A3B0SP05_9ZZZZ